MGDPFIDTIKENESILQKLDSQDLIFLALSELMSEMATGTDVPPGLKAKRISLSAELSKRAGIRW